MVRALLREYPRTMKVIQLPLASAFLAVLLSACGGADADAVGVASTCERSSDCPEVTIDGAVVQLQCIRDFSGGYCSIEGCTEALDCPLASTCVAHTDGSNYCFRDCLDKGECNANRPPDLEANCSSSFDFATPSDDQGQKACIPPSSGK